MENKRKEEELKQCTAAGIELASGPKTSRHGSALRKDKILEEILRGEK